MDELIERIRTAQDKMWEEKLTANTVVLNGKKYGCLFELGYRPSICGLTAELAPLPDNMEFIVQRREPQPKTNGGRIREMDDEELAEMFERWVVDCGCNNVPCEKVCEELRSEYQKISCRQCWLEWLRQGV